jgi:hypothetical protein
MTAYDVLQSLLDYECLFFYCDWLGSDLRAGHFFSFRCPPVNTPQLNTSITTAIWLTSMNEFSFTNDFRINYVSFFYTSMRTEYKTLPSIDIPCPPVAI